MAVIGINYCGGNYRDENDNLVEDPINYKSVRMSLSSSKEVLFESGNFIKDWYDAIKLFLSINEYEGFLMHSSSVDDFLMAGAPYEKAYLVIIDEKPVLVFDYQ